MRSIKVNPGETYQVHVGGADVAATVTVHAPTGRVVDEWTEEDFAILGASVEDLRADGYTAETVKPRVVAAKGRAAKAA